jgi:hypothetical protein
MRKKWHELLISALSELRGSVRGRERPSEKICHGRVCTSQNMVSGPRLRITLENSHAAALSYSNRHHGGLIDSIH